MKQLNARTLKRKEDISHQQVCIGVAILKLMTELVESTREALSIYWRRRNVACISKCSRQCFLKSRWPAKIAFQRDFSSNHDSLESYLSWCILLARLFSKSWMRRFSRRDFMTQPSRHFVDIVVRDFLVISAFYEVTFRSMQNYGQPTSSSN